jgi:TRAP-type mannitol/chloroaromatic compound transport system permease small subunit
MTSFSQVLSKEALTLIILSIVFGTANALKFYVFNMPIAWWTEPMDLLIVALLFFLVAVIMQKYGR